MAFRKQASLALAAALLTLCFGCADELNAPNTGDEQPVLPPTNVSAVALNNGDVQVTWNASSQPDINGYNLYRRDVLSSSGLKRINPNRILSTVYVDHAASPRREYEYRVTAVNTSGTESNPASVVIVTRDVIDDGNGKRPYISD